MSWWISLVGLDGEPVEVEPFSEGGTRVVGGSAEASLNVTYNYGECFRLVPIVITEGGGDLHGKKAAEVTPLLRKAVEVLGTRTFKDYWAPTPGNAGFALSILLKWAEQHPDAVFEVH